jgi:hypothetical protein
MPDNEPAKQPRWRFEVDSSEAAPEALVPYEDRLDSAWIELQVIHTAFRGVDQTEYWSTVRRLQELELVFLDRAELDDYYRECYTPRGSESHRILVRRIKSRPCRPS